MRRWLALVALAPVASLAATITINEPWVRPATKGGATDVYMELTVSESATLVDVRTPVATRVVLAQGRQRRPPPFALRLVAGQPVLMRDRETRIVLGRVERNLLRGELVTLTLVLRYADGTTQNVDVDAEVRRRSPSDDHRTHRH
jgi:copper(I)-binding protein